MGKSIFIGLCKFALIFLCVSFLCFAGYLVLTRNDTSAYALLGVGFIVLVAVFISVVLNLGVDIKALGSAVTIQKRIEALDQENKHLKELIEATLKYAYVRSEGAARMSGGPLYYDDVAAEILKPIADFVGLEFERDVEKLIEIQKNESDRRFLELTRQQNTKT